MLSYVDVVVAAVADTYFAGPTMFDRVSRVSQPAAHWTSCQPTKCHCYCRQTMMAGLRWHWRPTRHCCWRCCQRPRRPIDGDDDVGGAATEVDLATAAYGRWIAEPPQPMQMLRRTQTMHRHWLAMRRQRPPVLHCWPMRACL